MITYAEFMISLIVSTDTIRRLSCYYKRLMIDWWGKYGSKPLQKVLFPNNHLYSVIISISNIVMIFFRNYVIYKYPTIH